MLRVQPNIVFVEPINDSETTTDSGIILAQKTDRTPNRGTVTDIHETTSDESGVRVGDTVIFNPYSIRELSLGADVRYALPVNDILAIVGETLSETD